MTVQDVKAMRRLVRQWKPAHALGMFIYIVFAGNVWEPNNVWGASGNWGGTVSIKIPLIQQWGAGNWGSGSVWGTYLDS
jgi:hypothetical protein